MATVPPSSSSHPATWKFGYPIYHAETRGQVRAWLEENHAAEGRLAVFVAHADSGAPVPVPRNQRGGHLFRMDRLDGQHAGR
jgi:hypothetical protein